MVQAILDGRKTQTRRIAAVPVGDHHGTDIMDWHLSKHPYQENGKWLYSVQTDVDDHATFELKPKYGQSGDLLWVRETWGVGSRPDPFQGSVEGIEFKADGKYIDDIESLPLHFYDDFEFGNYDKSGWRPSIHMPKAISRIWLQATDVRVERLQGITEQDAIAEGVKPAHCESNENCPSLLCKSGCTAIGEWWNYLDPNGEGFPAYTAKESFETLWQSINGTDSWAANPWVWVISFKVLNTTGMPITKIVK